MPCDSSYMNATPLEIRLSRAQCLLDELDGKKWDRHSWDGYHDKVYNLGKELLETAANSVVATLCARLQKVDVTKYSLEMQIWWRDHRKADVERMKQIGRAHV